MSNLRQKITAGQIQSIIANAFRATYILSWLILAITVYFNYKWCASFMDGFDTNSKSDLNWHQSLMLIGHVFLIGNAIMIHRGTSTLLGPFISKTIHILIVLIAISISLVGLFKAYDFHRKSNAPDMSSTHSWIGFFTESLIILQAISGIVAFVFPGLAGAANLFRPFHAYFGIIIYVLIVATVMTGITVRASMSMRRRSEELDKHSYHHLPPEAFLANAIGFLIAIYIMLVVFLTAIPDFQFKFKLS